MPSLVSSEKLIAAVLVAAGALLTLLVPAQPYYPTIVAGDSWLMVSNDAGGRPSPAWDRETMALLDIVQTRLDLLRAVESTPVAPDCRDSGGTLLCHKMNEAKLDGWMTWRKVEQRIEQWKAQGGILATPVNAAFESLRHDVVMLRDAT